MNHFELAASQLPEENLQLRLDFFTKIVQNDGETDSCDDDDPDEIGLLLYSDWPKYIEHASPPYVVLGPNGTIINCNDFDAINWSTTKKATSALLGLVFSEYVLATHTPSGKRFSKKKLDPSKTDDIVHCALVMCRGGSEHAVRAAIVKTCAEKSKNYKVKTKKL